MQGTKCMLASVRIKLKIVSAKCRQTALCSVRVTLIFGSNTTLYSYAVLVKYIEYSLL